MVTLKRYLDGIGKSERAAASRPAQPWPAFTTSLVDSVSRNVLVGEPYGDIREDLRVLSENLSHSSEPPSSSADFDRNFEEFHRRSEDASESQCRDMRRMLGTMNEALLMLASGSERTVGALKQMESTLEHAVTLKDIWSLRSRVTEVIKLVSQETVRQHEESARAISNLHEKITAAKVVFQPASAEFQDREHAVGAIESAAGTDSPAFAGVFVLQRIRAIVMRYGRETATELLHQLIRERIQPLAPDAQTFVWSEDAAILLISGHSDSSRLNQHIRANVEVPFEHRIVSGGRIAMLKASVRSLMLPVEQPIDRVCQEIDRFVLGGVK
jgi:hypothetical protein